MIAVLKTGGKQYSVEPGQILKVEKVNGKKGEEYTFKEILAISDNSQNIFGDPIIKGASVEATIIDQIRGKKIVVYKKRRRKNYHSTHGHRQYLTVLRIESIINKVQKITNNKESNKIESSKIQTKTQKEREKKKTDEKLEKKAITKKTIKTKKNPKKTIVKKTTKGKK